MTTQAKYKRVLLKLTGEIFGGEGKRGLDFPSFGRISRYIHEMKQKLEIEIAIVVGGGNLFRAREIAEYPVDRSTADYIGMLGTVMNALALQEELERFGETTRVMSSVNIQSVCEPFVKRKAVRHLEKGRIVILAGGTGNPFFTTDSAAALKAAELNCNILLKASNTDGVYDSDPIKNKNAKLYRELSYQEALEKGLTVMDNTAFALCQNAKIPIVVFNVENLENIEKIIAGEEIGTIVTNI
ncbi:UMP kinase [Candidatus Roizmanbacteria bacterium]|nr:UMP kinase [Candidatus Roizmanbacteria bacterium]